MEKNIYGENLRGTLELLAEKKRGARDLLHDLKKKKKQLDEEIQHHENRLQRIQSALDQITPLGLAIEVINIDDVFNMDLRDT